MENPAKIRIFLTKADNSGIIRSSLAAAAARDRIRKEDGNGIRMEEDER